MKVSIVGLGYVGLPLAVAAAKSGFEVTGLDIDENKISMINSGVSPILDVSNDQINFLVQNKMISVSSDFSNTKNSEVIVICVPTPLNFQKLPDLSHIENVVKSIGKFLSAGTLVILESTVAPGTTRNYLAPFIHQISNLSTEDLEIAFSPERIDPSNSFWGIENTPKIVAGLTENALERANNFYSKFIRKVIKCSTLEIAETAKLLENSFRFVNIGFFNEIAIFCNSVGIDVKEVIEVASSKPYGFMPFQPGVGVGGHCIPVDPIYLAFKARSVGAPISMIELAQKINKQLPNYFAERVTQQIGEIRNKKILIVGVAYKPNVSDTRETPVKSLINELRSRGAQVYWHDNMVGEWNGEVSTPLSQDYDLAIIATRHDYLELSKLGDVQILDTQGTI